MEIIHINSANHNFITINNNKYFIFRLPSGESIVINDKCPHRGGPLHLGQWDENRRAIICPWHRIACKKQYLSHNGLPSIRVGIHWKILVEESESADIALEMRHIMPSENLNKMECHIV